MALFPINIGSGGGAMTLIAAKTASSSSSGDSIIYTYTAESTETINVLLDLFSTAALSANDNLRLLVNNVEKARLVGSTTASQDATLFTSLDVLAGDVITIRYVQNTNARIARAFAVFH